MTTAPNYGRSRPGVTFTQGLRRLFFTTAAVGALLYVGAACDFDQKVEQYFSKNKGIQEGYALVSLQRRVNGSDKLEYRLVDAQNREVPVLIGAKGPQAGDLDYVIDNIDYAGMTPKQAQRLMGASVQRLDQQAVAEYSIQTLRKMTKEQAAEYALKVWDVLESRAKYDVIVRELDQRFK
ncbi:hypothetical protein HYY74_00520 [Candidatus Woesearchaeota archaeon]|nr:hypothetical protein [Candidatus Woesearchaeota archaeon]